MPFETTKLTGKQFELLQNWQGDFLDSQVRFHDKKAGEYSDDTGLAMALAKSLLVERSYKPESAMKHYVSWFKDEDNEKCTRRYIKKSISLI